MKSALIVTVLRMQHLDKNVHGVFQRLRCLVEGVSRAADRVNIFALVPREAAEERASDELQRCWGIRANVVNGTYAQPEVSGPWVLEQLRWTWSYRQSVLFRGLDNPSNRATLQGLLGESPDLIVTHKLAAHEFLTKHARPEAPIVFDLDDIEHVAFARQAEHIRNARERWFAQASVPAIRRAVGRAVRSAANVLVCSSHDKERLDRDFRLPPDRSVVIPNSCTLQPLEPPVATPNLLFVGTFAWRPNVVAIEFFLDRCWAKIKAAIPEAKLTIVGANPEVVRGHARPPDGVRFAGFVPDIARAYRESRAVICPILSGGGTRVKLVEAAAFGKPIVSTTLGAEGLDFLNDRHALLRDDAGGFGAACIELLSDDRLCERLAAAVHGHARQRFDRAQVVDQIHRSATSLARTTCDLDVIQSKVS